MSAIIQAPWGTATATPITQAGHGFTLGQQVYFDGTSWQLAIATAVDTLRVATVAQVVDASRFLVMFEGAMQWPAHGLTLGATYYLSDTTPGAITPIPPAPAASIDQPCVKPITPDFVRLIDYVIVDSAPLSAFPTGAISPYAGQTASIQPGWLLCNGAEHSRSVYPDLFRAIGSIYGSASSGNFRVPDLRGRQLVMASQGSNRLSNSTSGTGGNQTSSPNNMSASTAVDSISWRLSVLEGNTNWPAQIGTMMDNSWTSGTSHVLSFGSSGYFRLQYGPTSTSIDRLFIRASALRMSAVAISSARVVVSAERMDGTRVECCSVNADWASGNDKTFGFSLDEYLANFWIDVYPPSIQTISIYELQILRSGYLGEGDTANDLTRMPRAGAWGMTTAAAHSHTLVTAGNHTHSQTTYRTQGSSEWGTNQFGHATDNDFAQTSTLNSAGAHIHNLNQQGAHTHTISGGDYQTRPASVAMNYLIKT